MQESNVKIELLEKRVDTFKKQVEQISVMDREAEKAKKQQSVYDEMIRGLQDEIGGLTEQNAQLRRMVKKPDPGSGKTPTPLKPRPHPNQHSHGNPMHDQEHGGSMSMDIMESGSSRDLLMQVDSLRSALRFLRSENASLRTRAAMLDLGLSADLSTLSGPLSRVSETEGPALSEADQSEVQKRQLKADSELKIVALESKRLLKDARIICASPKIVDLTKFTTSKAALPTSTEPTDEAAAAAAGSETATATSTAATRRPWLAKQTRPEWEYHSQQAALNTIQKRSQELKERLAKATQGTTPSAPPKLKKVRIEVRLCREFRGMCKCRHVPDATFLCVK